ncbi:MAG: deoxyribose-phosphate aldolase [Gammaproteobacteria bacterium]|nr:MAG: deoxyribose-phosphate aldolase [Gammaproteobacteria bacterium]
MSQKSDKDWARQALTLMDLTNLNDDAIDADIIELCQNAVTPFGHTAAVCVYGQFIGVAEAALVDTDVKVATVANFPYGGGNISRVEAEIEAQIIANVDEVDVVLPYKNLIDGDETLAGRLIASSKTICESRCLKVIIESGELKTPALIRRASEIAIDNGADFIKTSTGKVAVNATPEAAEIMLNVIKDSGKHIGFKAAGGVRTLEEAKTYLQLAERIMGVDWISPQTFRFGASGLLGNLLAVLNDQSEQTLTSY